MKLDKTTAFYTWFAKGIQEAGYGCPKAFCTVLDVISQRNLNTFSFFYLFFVDLKQSSKKVFVQGQVPLLV